MSKGLDKGEVRVPINNKLYGRLQGLKEKTGRSIGWYVNTAIDEWLETWEAIEIKNAPRKIRS